MDMGLKDYDSRSALHIAAAEGERRMTILSVCERKKKKPSFSMDAVIHGHFQSQNSHFPDMPMHHIQNEVIKICAVICVNRHTAVIKANYYFFFSLCLLL